MDSCIVYLPVYNGEKYLEATLESVLKQDYPNYRAVVCDDCSNDHSPEIIDSYAKQYPDKIVFLRNHRNLGVGTTLRNCYLKYHNARFFAQIGHDDIWPRNYLSSQISKLQDSEAVVSFAKNDYIDAKGKKLSFVQLFKPEQINTLKHDWFFLKLVQGNFLCAPASVVDLSKVDREIVTRFWGYNNERLQDCELWLNLSLYGTFIYNQNVTMHYRIHDSNLSDVEKRIVQGKLEYYTMLRRVLSSEAFLNFIEEQENPTEFVDCLLKTIKENFAYSNPLKLLVIDLCESFLNNGYESDTIFDYLNWMYMDTGIVTKCLKNGRHLPGQIKILLGEIKNKDVLKDLNEHPDFCVVKDLQDRDPKALCAVQEDGMEYLLNTAPYPYYFVNGQMIVFCENGRISEYQQKYPHLLVLSEDISVQYLSRSLYQFVEDRTHIYRNGFIDALTSPAQYSRNLSFHRICVKTDERIIRAVFIPEHDPKDCTIYTGTKQISAISSDTSTILLEETPLENGELFVCCEKNLNLSEQIILNNIIYICVEVIVDDKNHYLPIFRKLCYSSRQDVDRLSNFQLESLYASKVTELQQITTSLSYRVMMKIKRFLNKTRLNKFLKQIVLKLYRVIKGKSYGIN